MPMLLLVCMNRRTVISVASFILFILIATTVILLAQGYRFDRTTNTIQGTGILVVSTDPTGAVLTVNDELVGATNATINNLTPGKYTIGIEKDGYFPWNKEVEIEATKVLTVDALLIPVSPSLAPVTSTPAEDTWLSPDGEKLAYSVKNGTSAGIWMLDLSSQPFNLARRPILLAADTELIAFSTSSVIWSPNSSDLLLTIPGNGETRISYLVSIDNPQEPAILSQPRRTVLNQWKDEETDIFEELMANFDKETQEIIDEHKTTIQWSPDKLKFTYYTDEDGKRTYRTYNKETKKLTTTLEANLDTLTVLRWFADSHHLMVLEKDSLKTSNGSVSLVGMDGSNKQQVFAGTLIDDVLYSYLNGSKIIVLTSFNLQEKSYYLYTINLR